MQILPATRSGMYKINKSGNNFRTRYLRFVASAFWYNGRPGSFFMPGFLVTRNEVQAYWW